MSSSKQKVRVVAAFATLMLFAVGVGCKGFFSNPNLLSLLVGPSPLNLTQGRTQQMTATGNFDDNTSKTLTSGVVWSTSDAAVAPISNSGVVTATSAGTATITAQSGTVSGTGTVNVSLGNVTNLQITPTTATIHVTGTQLFNALGTVQGQSTPVDVSSTATWTANPSAAVSINNTSQTGALITPISSAVTQTTNVTITATYISNGTSFIANAQLTITVP